MVGPISSAEVIQGTVPDRDGLSTEDLRLVHALQVVPRAPWSRIGAVLGCDPVTAARRWARLREDGYAWVTAYRFTRRTVVALVELSCAPGRTLEVARDLAGDVEAITIDVTAGGRDLVITVAVEGDDRLGEYLLDRLGAVQGVMSSRTHVVTSIASDARSWRLRMLGEPELAALEAIPRPSGRQRAALSGEEFDGVLAALAADGRIRATDLAARAGIGVDRARASLNTVLAAEGIVVRTEVARRYSERPVYAWFFLRSPARSTDRVLRRLATLRDVRLLATSIGTSNIVLAMWLAGLDDVARVEAVIEQSDADVAIVDRSLVLRTIKHLGRRLTPDGRSVGEGSA
ncbi:Lrp/AsnC family transcriptional regulator [Tsukamurella sputi]|uniref:Lrp/AsnC family transcriptional regulator n=1 Tax=Tsukamurella sputi TaxID=2591848 RepID=UPI00131580CE|nr:Lrp/AsnC family transcriptional regulator [Tsukamurella sputi]